MDAAAIMSKPVGGVPTGLWIVVGGVGVYFAVRSSKAQQAAAASAATHTVEQVPVPVGAIGSADQAPMVVSPIVRINVPEIGKLTDAITNQTGATDANTLALGGVSGALGQNTDTLNANTGALGTNTAALGQNSAALGSAAGATNGLTSAVSALAGKIGTAVSAPPAAQPVAAPTPQAPPPARTYTIKSGDTLSSIAQRFTGSAARWTELYNANAGVIDSTARSRGMSGGGHWIFPGTVLRLPW